MNKTAVLAKVSVAQQELSDAQTNLEKVLRDLKIAVRADKSMIGEALETAIAKVKLAAGDLLELEKLIASALD